MPGSETQVETTDVLVVGAGPVGLALAVGLARAGVDCRIVERDPDFRDRGVRGKGVNPRTLEVLDDLGAADGILARSLLNPKLRTYEGSRVVHEVDPVAANTATPDRPYAGMVLLAQHHTEAVLRDRLAEHGGKVELGTELVDCAQDGEGVLATLRRSDAGTSAIRARYVVGCDGGRSTVRKLTGIPFLGETWEEERFIMASMRIDGLAPDRRHIWTEARGGAGARVARGRAHHRPPAPRLHRTRRLRG
ncbi:FAD-dependent monooxygenase [Kitasatospora sp. NPDC059722]|uniref:FAD-dependent monooxygenase n=1 Tax=Kitasatospora sp. NPDC059722 TaxID=3346925 RepID=UPI003699CA6F